MLSLAQNQNWNSVCLMFLDYPCDLHLLYFSTLMCTLEKKKRKVAKLPPALQVHAGFADD
jgi:hypothetical protein